MKSKKTLSKTFSFLVSVIILVTFNSCAITPGLQDARSLGKNNTETLVAITSSLPKSQLAPETRNNRSNTGQVALPSIEMGVKYGLTDKLDFSLRVSTSFSFITGVKYQFLGDRNSKYAMGTGFDYSMFGLGFVSGQTFQFPLYTSYHPSEKVSYYFNPRITHYKSKTDIDITPRYNYSSETNLTKFGWNAGILYGSKNKFGFDVGYALGSFNVGIGYKFLFIKNK